MKQPLPSSATSRPAMGSVVEVDCATLGLAVELLDELKALGVKAEFKTWACGRASFTVPCGYCPTLAQIAQTLADCARHGSGGAG